MRFIAVIATLVLIAHCDSVVGQSRVQFPSPLNTAPTLPPPGPTTGFAAPPNFGGGLAPPNQGAYLGGTIQPFDPYSLPGNIGPNGVPPGTGFGVPNFGAAAPPGFPPGTLATPPPGYSPNWQPPGSFGPDGALPPFPGTGGGAGLGPTAPPGFGSPGFGSPYGQPTPPTRPLSNLPSIGDPFGGSAAGTRDPYFRGSPYADVPPYGAAPVGDPYSPGGRQPPYQRLFQDTGLRATYLHGSRDDDLQMTEVEASTTAFLANFLGVPNGLRVTPGFAFHWTDGPQGPQYPHVPGRLYSGYVDFGLEPRFNQQVSAELSARVGIYSDFQAFNEDSIRLLGTAVGVFQTTPELALKLGVAYIDRVDIKLLPAAGVLWTPNPQTRWDLFFPAPKLSNYWTTIGNQQVWWYLGAEYGGGSWSIERETQPPRTDRIDINDIRLYAGLEWWNVNRYYGFLEVGYVFDREVVYYRVPGDSTNLDDTFMARGGISW